MLFYNCMNLGVSIRTIRKAKGLSQVQLAEMCETSQAYLSQVECNDREPSISFLKSIAEKLDIPLPVIFFHAIDEEDVLPHKKVAFKMAKPVLDMLVQQLVSID